MEARVKFLAALIALMAVFPSQALAQEELPDPGLLPDSSLYGLKKAFEAVRGVFVFGEKAKVEYALALAEKRLAEAEAMAVKGKPEFVEELSREYAGNIIRANEIAVLAGDADKKEELAELVALATSKHLSILDGVRERVPLQARDSISSVKSRSITGNQEALKALATENPEKAVEIAMEVAYGRINRAKKAAEEGDGEEAAEAAEEYEKYARFGEEIASIAQQVGKDPTKVQELVANATSIHVMVLQDVYEKVPASAKPAIGMAMNASKRGHEAATEALRRAPIPVPLPPQAERARAGKQTDGGEKIGPPEWVRPPVNVTLPTPPAKEEEPSEKPVTPPTPPAPPAPAPTPGPQEEPETPGQGPPSGVPSGARGR